jgi:hypothetical protein
LGDILKIEPLEDDLERFIVENFKSISELELLILLFATNGRRWSPCELSTELRSNTDLVANQLKTLHERGLIETEDGLYFFQRTEERLHSLIAKMSTTYPERRITIINLIYNKPDEMIRGLADAFQMRKKNNDNS